MVGTPRVAPECLDDQPADITRVDTPSIGDYPEVVMTAIAQVLDKKLKQWPPSTARKIERLLTEAIALADKGIVEARKNGKRGRSGKRNSFFADKNFWRGKVPKDSSVNHDKYLYGNEE